MILKDLLEKKQFQYLKVLNDNADLSRTVFTIESTETPDVAKYIPPNTLLIMTGMAFQNDPLRMCDFLEELNKRSCAGLAIKLGRFIDSLDQLVIDTADSLEIPLIQIPMDMTLGKVYQEILSYIWNNQNDYLLEALNAQQKISNLIRQGSSMKSIINNIALVLNKPIMVMDLFGEILEYSYTYMKTEREETAQQVRSFTKSKLSKSGYSIFDNKQGKHSCLYPIKGVGRNTNYVIISDFDPREKEENVLLIEHIIMTLELYFYRGLYVKYNEMEVKEKYLSLLIDQIEKESLNERQILAMGEFYGIKKMLEYRMVFLELGYEERRRFNQVNFSKKEERYILIYDWINNMLLQNENVIIFPQESKWRYVCLMQGDSCDSVDFFISIHDIVKEKFDFDIMVVLGGIVSSVVNLGNSFSEAEQCITDGSHDKEYPYLIRYKPKNMMELFKYIPEREIKVICEYTLKGLAYPHDQMEEELRKTLETYVFCNSSISKTAESLYLHRNTIKYRLKKCEEILETDLSDVSNCFQIQLALTLTKYAQ